MSRAYTAEEARDMFLSAARMLAHYWATTPQGGTTQERCEGVVFSLLNCIDGTSGSFPCALDLTLRPHPDDKAFHIAEDESYFEPGMVINDAMLHELFYDPASIKAAQPDQGAIR
jgi:hypothetical protein